jgi:hypothetical protein
MAKKKVTDKTPPGPQPERFKIDLSFEDAADRVVKAKKPKNGWPEAKKRTTKKKTR